MIGLPDEDLGAAVHAIVQPARGAAPSAKELVEFLGQRLARYKIPRSFELTEQTLRDEAGKVRRSHMRSERLAAPGRATIALLPHGTTEPKSAFGTRNGERRFSCLRDSILK